MSRHSVVTTVRSSAKADGIKKAYPDLGSDRLDFTVVADIAAPGAFDKAVVSDPPFDAVIHTASPFTFNVTDIKRDLLDPAINGTTGILYAIKKNAPTVKRVVGYTPSRQGALRCLLLMDVCRSLHHHLVP